MILHLILAKRPRSNHDTSININILKIAQDYFMWVPSLFPFESQGTWGTEFRPHVTQTTDVEAKTEI